MKNGLHLSGGMDRRHITGGVEVRLVDFSGFGADALDPRGRTEYWGMIGGLRLVIWRVLLVLSLRSLKIRYLKRYVGGLVRFDGSTSVYQRW
jgi:hypothetical protein